MHCGGSSSESLLKHSKLKTIIMQRYKNLDVQMSKIKVNFIAVISDEY